MTNVEQILTDYGIQRARELILLEGLTYVQFHKETGISSSNSRVSPNIYKRVLSFLGINEIPYKEDTQPMRKFKLQFDSVEGRYWESEYIVETLIDRLNSPVLNLSGSSRRYVIGFPKHPLAAPTSNQIKAHIVLWELINEMYVPDNYWVVPNDGIYTNLNIDNWSLVNSSSCKSDKFAGDLNPAYKHGNSGRHKLGGWPKVSATMLSEVKECAKCSSREGLIVHHIINYHLFKEPISAHTIDNLIVICQSCHAKIHLNNLNIKALIEETQYSKLLKLLETLKSQVPDSLIEIYKDVEKQLGLTDNQQPSP